MDAFERVHTQNMILSWIAFLGAGAFGIYRVIMEDAYASFFIGLGIAFVLSFSLHLRDGLRVLEPLGVRLQELRKSIEASEKAP